MTETTIEKILKKGKDKEVFSILGVVEGIYESDTSDRNKYVVADTTGRIDCIYWNGSLLKGIDTGTEVMIDGVFSIYHYTDKKTGEPGVYKSLTFKEDTIVVVGAIKSSSEALKPEVFKVRDLSEGDSSLIDDIIGVLKAAIEDLGMLKPKDDEKPIHYEQ